MYFPFKKLAEKYFFLLYGKLTFLYLPSGIGNFWSHWNNVVGEELGLWEIAFSVKKKVFSFLHSWAFYSFGILKHSCAHLHKCNTVENAFLMHPHSPFDCKVVCKYVHIGLFVCHWLILILTTNWSRVVEKTKNEIHIRG